MIKEYKTTDPDVRISGIKSRTVLIVPPALPFVFGRRNKCISFGLEQTVTAAGYSLKILNRKALPKELARRCSLLNITAVVPLYRVDQGEYVYYIAELKVDATDTVRNLVEVHESAERASHRNALVNFAYNAPELFETWAFSKFSQSDTETAVREPGLHCAVQSVRGITDNEPSSLKEMQALVKRFLHNVKKYKETNDKQAGEEIETVLENSIGITDDMWMTVVCGRMSPAFQREFFKMCIDRYSLGKNAKFKVVVKEETNNDKLAGNHGKYYVCLRVTDGNEVREIALNFVNQPTAVVYIMYLIDRKRKGNKVERVDLKDNIQEFTKLYNLIYGEFIAPSKIESHINKIITEENDINGVKIKKTGRLKIYYEDISKVLDKNISRLENPLPYKVNAKNHLTIPKENIEIPEKLMELRFR